MTFAATATRKANVPAADAQGIKERIAMDFERYGDVRVVKVERVGGAEQYEQQRIE